MATYDRTKPHLNIWNIRNVGEVKKFNPDFIPEKLKQIYREKLWISKDIDVVLSKSETNLSEEQIRNILLFFQWGFSDTIMFHSEMKSYLIEENGFLRWYFSHMDERLNEMDILLEKKLLERWLSYDKIVSFLISKSWGWLIDNLDFKTQEDWEWNTYYIPEHSMKVFRESIDENLDEILGNFLNTQHK